ncbi:acyltransferase [Cyanobacteria bacterium FACHB-DQ100]|nr:acyltransferase [Cyanobacteria bacterium FACHB-DQ100]
MIQRIIKALESRWCNAYYRFLGVKFQGYVWLNQVEIPRNFQQIEFEPECSIDRGVTLLCSGEKREQPKIYIGARTYVNRYTMLDASVSIRVGQDCAIGPGCYITDHDHGIDAALPPLAQPLISQPTYIGDRVWIGANATILKGVTIGNGAVIGAGSVVTKDIPANAIAVGVPAQVIRYRHPSELIKQC